MFIHLYLYLHDMSQTNGFTKMWPPSAYRKLLCSWNNEMQTPCAAQPALPSLLEKPCASAELGRSQNYMAQCSC